MPRTLIAGNWKMNGLRADLATLRKVAEALPSDAAGPEVLLCVPATLIAFAAEIAEASALRIGAQACHSRETGAHTGDLSAAMLKDAGASHVIVGHSERRADHGETSAFVAEQASAAIRAGLTPLICIGETLGQREKGEVSEVISRQLAGSLPADAQPASLVIAYEPVWAIGTGRVAGPEQIADVHALIRHLLTNRFGSEASEVRILYGGSMNPANAAEILQVANVNGGLIGGASLKAGDFLSIFATAAGR